MIKVMLVDDQQLIRQGIRILLEQEPEIEVIAEASNGIEALRLCRDDQPDVVLMDVQMPEMDGVVCTRQLTKIYPKIGVIILTTFDDDDYIFDGLRAGARGYLLKDVSSAELAAAVRTVAGGDALIQPSISRRVISEFARLSGRGSSPELVETLTPRELDVLAALADGLSNMEIAQKLVITEGTVKNHVSSLLAKLQVRDRIQAVLKAQKLNLLRKDE
ncbi:MAG: response regulator [Anaerolineales bacterium]